MRNVFVKSNEHICQISELCMRPHSSISVIDKQCITHFFKRKRWSWQLALLKLYPRDSINQDRLDKMNNAKSWWSYDKRQKISNNRKVYGTANHRIP